MAPSPAPASPFVRIMLAPSAMRRSASPRLRQPHTKGTWSPRAWGYSKIWGTYGETLEKPVKNIGTSRKKYGKILKIIYNILQTLFGIFLGVAFSWYSYKSQPNNNNTCDLKYKYGQIWKSRGCCRDVGIITGSIKRQYDLARGHYWTLYSWNIQIPLSNQHGPPNVNKCQRP